MGKQKVFSKESLMLSQNKNKEQVCRKSGRPVSLCKKIEMQYQICYTEQWYKRKYNKKRNANESE